MRFLLTILAVIGIVGTAQAEGTNWRFGIGIGRVNLQDNDVVDLDADGTAWEAFGGWEFNKYLSVEAGYLDAGNVKDTIQGVSVEVDATAWQASVIGTLPFSESWGAYLRAGLLDWKADGAVKGGGLLSRTKDDGQDGIFGAGFSYTGEGNALLRLEYRIADLDGVDLSLISAAIVWRF